MSLKPFHVGISKLGSDSGVSYTAVRATDIDIGMTGRKTRAL